MNQNKKDEEVKCEKLYNGTVGEKLRIARKFKENFDILENIKKGKIKAQPRCSWDHVIGS